jgi:tRNA 2-thiouridine synthesizing protein A
MARIDVPWLMAELGGRIVSLDERDGILTITVETRVAPTD